MPQTSFKIFRAMAVKMRMWTQGLKPGHDSWFNTDIVKQSYQCYFVYIVLFFSRWIKTI